MIWNIVDHRKRSRYQWAQVWGVVEPTWHDNSVKGASQAPRDEGAPSCQYAGPMAMSELLRWAARFAHAMTLYVYDEDPMDTQRARPRQPEPTPKSRRHTVQIDGRGDAAPRNPEDQGDGA